MRRSVHEILEAITRFEPDDGNWLKLNELLDELWKTSESETGIDVMLGVLERFTEEDRAGEVLWSIVHGLEALPDYEAKLIESLGRQPSELGLVMISLILNTGAYVIGQQPVHAILEQVLNNEKTIPALRKQTEEIKERVNNLR